MTPYDNAKFYGYNSVEEYYEAQKHDSEIFLKGLEKKKTYVEKEIVKHGRWIDIYEYCKAHDLRPSGLEIYYWCSECDKAEKKTSDFCPNCGAKMDLKED